MKIKQGLLLAAVVLTIGMPAMAKDKGNAVAFPNWGTVMMPTDMYMEQSYQPMLTAESYHHDVTEMLGQLYPTTPTTYQLVKKDDAHFQYGHMVRYTMTVWDIEAALEGKADRNSFLKNVGTAPDLKSLVATVNERLKAELPSSYRLKSQLMAKKKNGKVFYEGTVEKMMVINDNGFTETIKTIAWQHGTTVEIAILIGDCENGYDLVDTMADALESAQKMAKK